MSGSTLVTAGSSPDSAAVLEADLHFHMGERDWYNFRALEQACARRFPHDACVAFKKSQIIAGEFYVRHCVINGGAIRCVAPHLLHRRQRLVLAMIARDLAVMDDGPIYYLDMLDHRYVDYGSFFETAGAVPAFQYHRFSARAAIIHPLPAYHGFPSENIPPLFDHKPFREKRSKMFWRGRLHGWATIGAELKNLLDIAKSPQLGEPDRLAALRQSLRIRLCEAASQSDVLDAGLVINWSNPNYPAPIAALETLRRETISRENQLEYKYLLALDGYDGPSTHYWAHATNSLVLRQESPWQMFGDSYFAPWVHYVPFAADGSDLFDRFEWCERHQPECERIVENARQAWSILFEPRYQRERRKAVFHRYHEWYKDSC